MSASIAPTKAAKVPESGAADAPDATETAQTCTEKAAPASVAQNGAERDELAAALVRQICISTELRRERDEARAAVSRLNRRVQVAESAIAELTGTGEGKASQVSREIWTRCEESHGLLCATTSRARGTAVALEAENALLSEGVERLSSKIYKLRREAMDDLMALDRVLYAKDPLGRRAAWREATTRVMEHRNPDMTPERYAAELEAWWKARKAEWEAER